MSTFKERIRLIRNGQSQQEMADLLGITKNKWSTWELGKYEPNLDSIIAICEKFNVSADWILGLRDDKPSEITTECQTPKLSNVSKALLKISENTKDLAKSLDDLSRTL